MKRLLSYSVANLQGKGSRDYQEDSFGFVNALDVTEIRNNGLFAAVADGMGGMRGGKEASSLVMKTMMTDFGNMDRKSHLGLQLAQSILRAGDLVYQMLRGAGGSTIVAGIFYNEMLYFASVGDSTIWLVRDGEMIRLNEPHNMRLQRYHEALSDGSMDPFPGRMDPQSFALTQHVGMEAEAKVDMNYRPLRLENTFFASPERIARFENRMATGYDDSGLPVPGKFPRVPDLAASGLWSTPKELLMIAEAFIGALHGESTFLQAETAREMAKPVKDFPWTGLGVFTGGEGILVSQGWGENGQCMLKMNTRTKRIAAVMTNRNPGVDQKESGIEQLADSRLNEGKDETLF